MGDTSIANGAIYTGGSFGNEVACPDASRDRPLALPQHVSHFESGGLPHLFTDLAKRLDEQIGQFETLIAREVPKFNRRAESAKLGALLVAAP